MDFKTLLARHRKGEWTPPKTMLCLDPGFTTGVAVFTNGTLTSWEQVTTIIDTNKKPKIFWDNLQDLFIRVKPDLVVCEDYRIYEHKLDQHSNSGVDTLRLIGGIDQICNSGWYTMESRYSGQGAEFTHHNGVPIVYQMANMAKGFCTDEKLKAWGYWQPGMRHSRDAIRHGCYYLLFNKEEQVCGK